MSDTVLSSMRNPRVAALQKLLTDNRARRQAGVFVAEGLIEIGLCLRSGIAIDEVWICPEVVAKDPAMTQHLPALAAFRKVEVTAEVFSKLAYRGTTGGVLLVGRCRQHRLADLRLSSSPLILVLSGVEKPGNIGAMLRTADAAAIDAVVVCDPLCDLYNPNAVRASLGTVFTQQIAVCNASEAQHMFRQKGIQMLCTALGASVPYTSCDMSRPTAVVMGTEHDGLSQDWLDASDQNIIIPMSGMIDSLNVSTAAAIVLFEAKRQRAS